MRLKVCGWSDVREQAPATLDQDQRQSSERRVSRAEVGRWGEELAAAYVQSLGWRVMSRNWRCRIGELDLVALDGPRLVFVEVRTLRAGGVIRPEETVIGSKRRQVARVAQVWLSAHVEIASGKVWCFDVLGVRWPAGALTHIREAFEGEDRWGGVSWEG